MYYLCSTKENKSRTKNFAETMKTYSVKTQSSNNQMLLHSIMETEFITTSLQEAEVMFDKEVAALTEAYDTYEQVCEKYPSVKEYGLSDSEQNNAIYCSIVAVDEDGDVEFIKDSEYFYER